MCSTPAPPSTAFVAASIWSGVGEVNTSPGQAASSMPVPDEPAVQRLVARPPPETIATLPRTGSFDPHDVVGLGVHAQPVAVGRRDAGELVLARRLLVG